eukprot:gene6457-7121_t
MSSYRPSGPNAQYLSCPHINVGTIAAAKVRLDCLLREKVPVTSATHVCLVCSRYGSFASGADFRKHLTAYNHLFCMRAGSPHEIYCLQCGDYQYCSLFDRIAGRKRPFLDPLEALSSYQGNTLSLDGAAAAPRGLINMGATCFINSSLQVLCSFWPFAHAKAFLKHKQLCASDNACSKIGDDASKADRKKCIACEFHQVAQALWSPSDRSPLIPSDLLYSFWKTVDYMAGYVQQDAHEFLIAFLNCLESCLDNPQEKDNDSFSSIYSGVVQSTLHCACCSYSSVKKEQFIDLSLSMDSSTLPTDTLEASEGSSECEISLHDCLGYFTISEQLSQKMFCPKCNADQLFQKQLSIFQSPDLLILHLKRFDFMRQKKINDFVRFPIDGLDLSAFRTSTLEAENDQDPSDSDLYNLQGLVCHSGSLHQGHYISYVRKEDGQGGSSWLRCDDERISFVSEADVESAQG